MQLGREIVLESKTTLQLKHSWENSQLCRSLQCPKFYCEAISSRPDSCCLKTSTPRKLWKNLVGCRSSMVTDTDIININIWTVIYRCHVTQANCLTSSIY